MREGDTLAAQDPALSDVRDMLSTADGQKEFIDWLNEPVTRKMLMAARILAKPRPMGDGVSSDYLLGETCGAHKIIDFFIGPQSRIVRTPVNIAPTYGAAKILKEEDN